MTAAVAGVAAALLCIVGAVAGAWAITGSPSVDRRTITADWWYSLTGEERAAWQRWLRSYGIDPRTVPLDGWIERHPRRITHLQLVDTVGGFRLRRDEPHVRRRRVPLLHPPSPFPT